MFLLELYTESGAVYVANVVHQKIRRISPEGEKSDWRDYLRLNGGEVGQRLVIQFKDDENPTVSTPVVRLAHPEVE